MHFGSKACVSHVQNQNRSKLRTFHRYCEPQNAAATEHAVAEDAPPLPDTRPPVQLAVQLAAQLAVQLAC